MQGREVVDQMYMAVKEPELDIEEVFDKVQREIGTVRNKERRLWWNVIKYAVAVVLPLGLGVAGYILWKMCIRDRSKSVVRRAGRLASFFRNRSNSCHICKMVADRPFSSAGIGAVSYTHLDVYKRQT